MTTGNYGTALVTGAGRGIGRAIALSLADIGFNLVVNDLPGSADLAETVELIAARGAKAVAVACDISDLAGHEDFVERAWAAFGGIESLVNNAGVSVKTRGDLFDVTPESFDRLININLRGPFFLTQKLTDRMRAVQSSRFRSVVTVTSANADFVSPDRGEYCISKVGLSMTSSLFAVRLAEFGINAYEVRPGVINTQMTAVARERYDKSFANGLTPIARWGQPEEVATMIATLASGAFPYSTGDVYRVDGGLAIRRL